MALFAVPTYTSWQLACIAAVEPLGGPHPERLAEEAEIRGELRLRGKSDAEIDEIVSLAKRIAGYICPMVCMDIDDLAYGIEAQASDGVIDEPVKERLIEFVKAHIDAPREGRQMPELPDDGWPGPSLPYMLGRLFRSVFRRR
jgi:hypothetical protein